MSFSHFFYQLFIGPLELFFETAYVFVNKYLYNSGLSIIVLSLIVNTLLLPMYRSADIIQDEERTLENRLADVVRHIKKTFQGDERTMMLQTYYRQNNYKPYYALKASLPLVLMVPFFMAAYHFLSNLQELHGMRFGPIIDLGSPDMLLSVGSYKINVLPITMTAINCMSCAIYAQSFKIKEKLQLYGMALIFLILLYNSPSGLVLYWTMNNLFSLGKSLFKRTQHSREILTILLAVAGTVVLIFAFFFFHSDGELFKPVLIIFGMILFYPLLRMFLKDRLHTAILRYEKKTDNRVFISGCVFAALLTGVLIPSAVIISSPAEFVLVKNFYSPVRHILNAALLSTGFFVIWLGVFYYLSSEQRRPVFCLLVWLFCGIAVTDYMFFGTNLGTMSGELKYIDGISYSSSEKILNAAVIIGIALIMTLVFFKKRGLIRWLLFVMIIAVSGMSAFNIASIQRRLPEVRQTIENLPDEKAHFSLSKNGKNVIVLMLDRAISSYVPYILQEDPVLEEQFAGFTYYPNTISFGPSTRYGVPALFGGYEYTPEKMNERDDELLVDKHNEALKVMPVIFDEAGFSVTVCDPSYAGYSWIPDISIYEDHPSIKAFVTEQGQYLLLSEQEQISKSNHIWERNFFCYGIMKISPLLLQRSIYYNGTYLEAATLTQTVFNTSYAVGLNSTFMNSYSVLNALPEITEVSNNERGTFLMMSNSATHEPALLSEPEFEPAEIIDNSEYDDENSTRFIFDGREMKVTNTVQMTHYHVNMAALKKLGTWMDYLRENSVYDNTRIIIVSDHGRDLNQFPDLRFGSERYEDVMFYNPLLMVKDFGSSDYTVSNEFMTNADVPTLALKELIDDPINPFTGKKINNYPKYKPVQNIFYSDDWQPQKNDDTTFDPGKWYSVHDDIFDIKNWRYLGEY